jgi:hypothetical protein
VLIVFNTSAGEPDDDIGLVESLSGIPPDNRVVIARKQDKGRMAEYLDSTGFSCCSPLSGVPQSLGSPWRAAFAKARSSASQERGAFQAGKA